MYQSIFLTQEDSTITTALFAKWKTPGWLEATYDVHKLGLDECLSCQAMLRNRYGGFFKNFDNNMLDVRFGKFPDDMRFAMTLHRLTSAPEVAQVPLYLLFYDEIVEKPDFSCVQIFAEMRKEYIRIINAYFPTKFTELFQKNCTGCKGYTPLLDIPQKLDIFATPYMSYQARSMHYLGTVFVHTMQPGVILDKMMHVLFSSKS